MPNPNPAAVHGVRVLVMGQKQYSINQAFDKI
jgi:hypothetical protein